MKVFVRTIVACLVVLVLLGAIGWAWVSRHQFSATVAPGRLEAFLTRQLRHLAIGPESGNLENPLPRSEAVVREGMARFAGACAGCHANSGSGDTDLARGLYPKVPDMRLPSTQSLTDGELFAIIENGVRFSGMPAWSTGTPEGERTSWQLVHFIRHLPALTTEEIKTMETLNPKSLEDVWKQLEADKLVPADSELESAPVPSTPAE